jgi:5'(3')-deoxyribonucleotidase
MTPYNEGMKKIVYLDMDGVLANFWLGVGRENPEWNPPEMYVKGFFRNLPVVPGAREAVSVLLANPNLDVYIASKPDSTNLYSATEKYEWIREHFPELIKKIFLTCDKGHLNGDFLVDDNISEWGEKFKGTFLHFYERQPLESWARILQFLDVTTRS